MKKKKKHSCYQLRKALYKIEILQMNLKCAQQDVWRLTQDKFNPAIQRAWHDGFRHGQSTRLW